MTARSKARKRALDILYEAEIRSQPVLDLLSERTADASPPITGYATELVRGVKMHQAQIDELLSTHAEGWALDRMPAIDRNILRIGTFELLWRDDIPAPVAISEAVTLAGDLSTDSSSAFVNGLLARVLEVKPSLDLAPDHPVSDRPEGGGHPVPDPSEGGGHPVPDPSEGGGHPVPDPSEGGGGDPSAESSERG